MSVVPYEHVEFHEDTGREKWNKSQTEFYKDEQEPARGAKTVKARFDSNRNPCKTSNEEYSGIIKMLKDNNVSDEGACKKMTETENRLNLVEGGSV